MRQLLRFHALPVVFLLLFAGEDQLAAQDVLIRDATVYTMAGQGILEGGDVQSSRGRAVMSSQALSRLIPTSRPRTSGVEDRTGTNRASV